MLRYLPTAPLTSWSASSIPTSLRSTGKARPILSDQRRPTAFGHGTPAQPSSLRTTIRTFLGSYLPPSNRLRSSVHHRHVHAGLKITDTNKTDRKSRYHFRSIHC